MNPHAMVAYAIKRGRLPSPKTLACVDCGSAAVEYDHRDYNKPLDVQPVCRQCNRRRGPAIKHPDYQATVSFTAPARVLRQVDAIARAEGRTRANVILRLVTAALRAQRQGNG